MKPYLTVNRLKNYVRQYLAYNSCDTSEVDEICMVVERITCTMQEPLIDDNGDVIYEEVPGWCNTDEDWLAYLFNKWGCYVTCTQDWIDGSPTYTISMPQTLAEEKENKYIWATTWG